MIIEKFRFTVLRADERQVRLLKVERVAEASPVDEKENAK